MSGPELMREMRSRFPNLTIEELLDRVRSEMVNRYVAHLKTIQANDVKELLTEARRWDLSREDVTGIVLQISKTFPEPMASEAAGLPADGAWSLYTYRDPEPPRGCCFNWRSSPSSSRSSST
ncbi:hypothetical protein [Yellowstone lake phycodnavirus 3]|uniref:hypothetical protein n=1 Tax=Yellowstone lake phycodnavirus 3 TaxID=1586715 RepID=UPI0006EB5400|nr:hypothetical protein AR677_gp080 [Yellowstone lake phycodnavirus 3]BAT22579.1 hypothetical protein [Yellowstone lake phycodnavirus 3]